MPFPAGATTITVTGKFPIPAGGDPQAGAVIFTPSATLVDGTQHAIYSGSGVATLDATGAFSKVLLCTDDTDVQPAGWRWRVDEQIPGSRRTYFIDLPSTLGATVDLSTVAPVSGPGGSSQSLPPTGPAGGALTGSYPNPTLAAATTASFDAAGSASTAQTNAEAYTDSVAALLLHLTGGTLTGDLTLNGANLTVKRVDGTGAYRLRVTGGGLDFEIGGLDVIVSHWTGADFTGTQTNMMRWEPSGPHLIGRTQLGSTPYDTVFDLDAAGSKLGLFGAAAVARQTVTGSRTDGTALQSLLVALAAYGLIVDNSTA